MDRMSRNATGWHAGAAGARPQMPPPLPSPLPADNPFGARRKVLLVAPRFMAPLFAVGAVLAVQCVEGVPVDAVLKGAGLAPDGNFALVFEHDSFDLVPANSAALPVIVAQFKPLEQPAPIVTERRSFQCPTCHETESVPWHDGLTVRCSECQVDAEPV
jgi:hypothetical protein